MPYSLDRFPPDPTPARLLAGADPADRKNFNPLVFGQLVVAARALLNIRRAGLAAATSIHHSNLAKMERGESIDLARCAKVQRFFELAGIEFFSGTREIALRYNPGVDKAQLAIAIEPSMPAGTRLVHPRALDLDDLLSVLKSVGIHVEGEDTLRDMAKHSNDWCDTVLNLALAGRKYGVRFIRPPSGGFSAQGLVEQLQAFPFVNDSARLAFVRNILPAGDRQVE